MSENLVIIPTYKEKENIEKIIRYVFNLSMAFDILIIDDNSPDGTADIVKGLMAEFSDKLFILERPGKMGLGTAYITGFKWALERDYQYVFEMDADLSVGSRYKTGVNVVNWPMGRVLMSYYASAYVRFITRMKVRDTTAGFVCYTRKVLETIDFDRIKFWGYAFQIEMKYTAWKLGFRIEEVPIIFTDRREGQSKMSKGIFREAVFGVVNLRWRGMTGKIKPRKHKQ